MWLIHFTTTTSHPYVCGVAHKFSKNEDGSYTKYYTWDQTIISEELTLEETKEVLNILMEEKDITSITIKLASHKTYR